MYFFTIKQSIVGKCETDSKIYKPDKYYKEKNESDTSDKKRGESETDFCKYCKRNDEDKTYYYRYEKIEPDPSKDSYIGTEMFSREIEIFCIRKFFSRKIGFIDILHKEISIGISTDENCYNTKKKKNSTKYGNRIVEQKFFRTRWESEFTVTTEILIYDNPDKWEGNQETDKIRIKKNAYFGEIPMKEILIKKYDVLKNPFKMGNIYVHKHGKIGSKILYKYICFSVFASICK